MKHHKLAKTPFRRNKLAKTSAGTNFARPGSSDLELAEKATLREFGPRPESIQTELLYLLG
jgi:hypothetical protein